MHMSEIQDTGKIFVPEEEETPKKKFQLILIPAAITLVIMVVIFLLTAYISTKKYNVRDGIFGSPGTGLRNFQVASGIIGTALQNTLLVKVFMLAVCGVLSAALCTIYKAMKKPGTVLTAACLWLVPLVLPSFMLTLAFIHLPDHTSILGAGLLHLLSEGLQTISLFCFTAGIFAYLHMRKGIEAEKGAYSGLLTAILVWLLGNMTTNGILFVFQNAYPYSNTFDWAIFTNSFVGSTGAGNAIAVIKVLLQVLIGIIPVIYLRRRVGENHVELNKASGEFWLFPIAGISLVPILFGNKLADVIGDKWVSAAANSILLAVGAGAFGCLIAWSLIRLMSRASGKALGIIAIVLAAALSCAFMEFMFFHRVISNDTLLPQVLTVIFDWRMVLVIIILAFILRNHKVNRPASLMAALALLAGAISWSGLYSAYIYGASKRVSTLSYMYYGLIANIKTISSSGSFSAYGMERLYWPWALLIYAAPLLLGLGAALLTRRAFKEAEPVDDSPAAVPGQGDVSDRTTKAGPEMQEL